MRLLFVCTGNICRSPLAERLASSWAELALGPAAAAVHIRSAGIEALEGHAMDKRSATALDSLGGDPSGFTARTLQPAMVEQADLVLTMTRKQRRSVLNVAPGAMRRTFTLPEAADLLRSAETDGLDQLPIRHRAGELAVRLNAGRAWRRGGDADDIYDPIGQSGSVHSQVAARIARKLQPLTDVLFVDEPSGGAWPPPPPTPSSYRTGTLPPVPVPGR
jgi:protein-tyrosine phosphatase